MKRRTTVLSDDTQARYVGKSRGNAPCKSFRSLVKTKIKKKVLTCAASSISSPEEELEEEEEEENQVISDVSSNCKEMSALALVTECQSLHAQLKRVLTDYHQQNDEIVALRVLTQTLKDKVKTIQKRQCSTCRDNTTTLEEDPSRFDTFSHHTNAQVLQLEEENAELRRQLEDSQKKFEVDLAHIAQKMAGYKLAAVKADGELCCVKSQLEHERIHAEHLQRQLVRWKARQEDDGMMHVSSIRTTDQEEHDAIKTVA